MSPGKLVTASLSATEAHAEFAWWAPVVYLAFLYGFILVMGIIGARGAKEKVPRNPVTRVLEFLYLYIEKLCEEVIGPHGKKYVTFIFTIFTFIFTANIFGLTGLITPTSVFGITLGTAVTVMAYVEYEGLRTHGLLGYVRHFMGPSLPMPQSPLWRVLLLATAVPAMALLFLFVEGVSELLKNISLSARLYGNMSAEHTIGTILGSLTRVGNFDVPWHTPLVLLGVLVSLVQTMIFTILTCVYLATLTQKEEHAH
jgi:F-type H+-transporting ATPase subunit a